jgi:dTMP kinase
MKKGKKRGKIVVIDGIDGSGKKTQTELLVKKFKREKQKVVRIDFPQYENNFFGKLLKEVLGNEKYNFLNIDPVIASVLYAADRWESKQKLNKYLDEGYLVILDRYVSSNQIHQGGKFERHKQGQIDRKKFMDWLDEMEHKTFAIPRPHKIYYLSLELDTVRNLMLQRAKKEKHRVDVVDGNVEHLRKSRDSAILLSDEHPKMELILCDDGKGGIRTIEEINKEIFDKIKKLLK